VSFSIPNIERYFGASFAGLQPVVKVVVPDDVLSFNDANAEAGVTVKQGKQIYTLKVEPRSGVAQEQLRGGVHGDHHERSLAFTFRHNRQELVDLRASCMNQRVHVIFTDANCTTYLYTNLRLRAADATSETAVTSLRFEGSSVQPTSFVQGVILPPAPSPEIDEDISGPTQTPDEIDTSGGTDGGAADVDLGGPTDGGDGGDGGGDGGDGDAGTDVGRLLQPSTGDYFTLTVTACEGLLLTKIT
jgi:hypothetical protein